jgi:hypothetical protein
MTGVIPTEVVIFGLGYVAGIVLGLVIFGWLHRRKR